MAIVNGVPCDDLAGVVLADYLKDQGYQPERIVVERNERIVPKKEYGNTVLQEHDVLEILNFVGGG